MNWNFAGLPRPRGHPDPQADRRELHGSATGKLFEYTYPHEVHHLTLATPAEPGRLDERHRAGRRAASAAG